MFRSTRQEGTRAKAWNPFTLTVEPVPYEDHAPSDQVALIHTIPKGGMAHIRHLLFSLPGNPPYTSGFHEGTPKGIVLGLRDQAEAALLHTRLSLLSVATVGLDGAKDLAEQVANILTGGEGRDLDQNGQVENPGDHGPGVIGYAQDASNHAGLAVRDAPGMLR